MQDTCDDLRANSSSDAVKNVEVSSDRTRQRRRYSSLNGCSYSNIHKKWKKLRY